MGYDTKQILNTANSFLSAADRCFEPRPLGPGKFEMPIVPAVVCTAFAIELYLKTLITLESGTAKGHDLSTLYARLSKNAKDALAKNPSMNETELKKKIEEVAAVFVEWRYIFESQSANVDSAVLTGIAKACKALAESALKNVSVNGRT